MRDLRTIRIFLAVLFFAASVAYLFVGSGLTPVAVVAKRVQIVPSALGMTMGATGFWLVATFVLGRVYCSTVCPVGALQDSASWLRRKLSHVPVFARMRFPINRRHVFAPYRYRRAGKLRWLFLLGYVVCLLLGLLWLATTVEPWNMMRSAARVSNPAANAGWLIFAADAGIGAAFGCAVLFCIWLAALLSGRRFCTDICPVGSALGAIAKFSIYHIEIDPDRCTNCMRCEDVCKTEGIRVVDRYVDNERCVRCFDCLKVCADDAINLQRNRNQRMDPLMRKSTGGEGA
ncbi:MAG: 4Fe-4S dicluster domain-containing protein [Muribaculaceae bacterium]|nr:4Fe-4S dicluster domain-containing protein [Muribaculaceae bacterium]